MLQTGKMNARVLELLKQPKNIQKEDLQVLKDEIQTFPYLQNVRALHLYGVHLYDAENYQKELSKTAAYTTDKKNLYHLINGKVEKKQEPVAKAESSPEKVQQPLYVPKNGGFPLRRVMEETVVEEKPEITELEPEIVHTNEPVFVDGERNRILFKGEENFIIEEENITEAESLVTENIDEVVEQPEVSIVEEIIDEAVEVHYNQSEIKVSPEVNLEEAVDFVGEDQAISFQEIEPLEVEIKVENVVEEVAEEDAKDEVADFTPETIIDEDKIHSELEKDLVEDDAQLSFHGTESFLPDVKIESSNLEQAENNIAPSISPNKYEDEMRRLIEQVEQKMKESKKEEVENIQIEEEETSGNFEISFAETQSFEVETPVEEISKNEIEVVENSTEEIVSEEELVQEEVEEPKSAWKPMSFETNALDSTIGKTTIVEAKTTAQPEIKAEPLVVEEKEEMIVEETQVVENVEEVSVNSEIEIIGENIVEEEASEVENAVSEVEKTEENTPAFNVSFFGNNISSFKKEEEKEEQKAEIQQEIPLKEEPKSVVLDSNVPGFINTWQSWLKIDRTEEVEKEKAEIKEKAIETFIETNPRISQLKDEVTFVVKEKNDDISHLMTETLAKLYTEQKLYTKAIQAYKVLIEKHPGKKEYFEEKIQEIKENRGR